MQGENYSVTQYSISAILGFIEAGEFVIPEIQRPFVWKRSQVRDLIDSLYHGYPTGYLIIWKNPDVKTKDGGTSEGKKILIDGQQRITALMAAISGKEVLDEDFNLGRISIAFNPLEPDKSKQFAVQDASHLKDKRWIPDISIIFKPDFRTRGFVPAAYLKDNGIKERTKYNQVANFTYLDTQVNKSVGKKQPNEYFKTAFEQCESKNLYWGNISEAEDLLENLAVNCIPVEVKDMTVNDYFDFLQKRRQLMARKIKDYYLSL